jgi:hypothetical protein
MPIILPPSTTATTSETAGGIIEDALSILRVNSQDITLDAGDLAIALRFLNRMVASWANESLTLYHVTRDQFVTTPNYNPHTWGAGGTWTTDRPIQVLQASVTVGSGTDFPVAIMEYDDYEAIRLKSLATNYPQYLYYDANWPLANVYLYPVAVSALTINIDSYKALSGFTYAETVVSLPAGYSRALVYNLAVELAPIYQISAGTETMRIADEAKRNLKIVNSRVPTLQVDKALLSNRQQRYNIFADGY